MNDGAILLLFVILACVGLFLQGAALLAMFFATQRLRKEMFQVAQDARQKADQAIQAVTQILSDAREPVRTATTNFAEVSKVVRNRAVLVDEALQDITIRTRSQVAHADQVFSGVLNKVETTANVVERNIVSPLVEIAAIFKGIQVGLDQLFRGRASTVREATQDEEMFI
jgi:ABC-type transporter Mla subunit MlaD